jgi:hypothetical protein
MGKMHADELNIDLALAARLIASQFPQWADLPLSPVLSAGTDNAIFRLGDEMALRLPRVARAVGLIALPYYQDTNPVFAATARRMIAEVLVDHSRVP